MDIISLSKTKEVEKRLDQAIQDGNNLSGWTAESEQLNQKIDAEISDVTAQLAQTSQEVVKPQPFGYVPRKQIVELWQSGHGWVKTSPAGAIEDDLINFRTGNQALKLTTTPASTTCWAEKSVTLNALNESFEIDVHVTDAENISSIDFILSTTSNFSGYFAASIVGSQLFDGWNTLSFNPRQFNNLGTTPPTIDQLSNIVKLRVKAVTNSTTIGQDVSVTFDRIVSFTNPLSRGKVVLRFDDGHNTVYSEAKPAMDKYGFRGVAYVITSQHENAPANRMTMDELYTLQGLGWDIASHTVTHRGLVATNPTLDELKFELMESKKWLIDKGFIKGADHIATPGGQHDPVILNEIKKYYSTHSTVMDGYEHYPPADPHRLRIKNVVNTTSVDTVKKWIDNTSESKDLLILTFHYFMNPADTSTKVLPSDFQAMMDYLATANVDVVTMSDLASYRDVM